MKNLAVAFSHKVDDRANRLKKVKQDKLASIVDAIHDHAKVDPENYLEDTIVPAGGE